MDIFSKNKLRELVRELVTFLHKAYTIDEKRGFELIFSPS